MGQRHGTVIGLTCAFVLAGVLVAPRGVQAQRTNTGSFRFGLGSLVAGYNGVGVTTEDPSSSRDVIEVKTEGFIGGLARPQLDLSARVGDGLWMGVTLRLGISDLRASTAGSTSSSDESATIGWGLLGHLEYVFVEGSDVRPYLKGYLGGSGYSASAGSGVGFTFGLEGGLHFFAADNIAISPSIQFDFAVGGGQVGSRDASYEQLVVGGALALTGWFGGEDEAGDDETPYPDPGGASAATYTGAGVSTGAGDNQPIAGTNAPAATPAPPSDLRQEVLLVDRDFTVYVLAAPLSRPGQVAFRLVRIGQGAGYLACEEILIATDLSAIPTTLGEHSTHAVGGATQEVLVGVTTPEAARTAATARDVALVVCDRSILLTDVAKAALGEFLDRMEAAAGGGGGAGGAGGGGASGGGGGGEPPWEASPEDAPWAAPAVGE